MSQFDLFDPTNLAPADRKPDAPRGAAVIPFPLSRNVGKARGVARRLLGYSKSRRNTYWRQIVANIRKSLSRIGASDDLIDAEIDDFHALVAAEMRLAVWGKQA